MWFVSVLVAVVFAGKVLHLRVFRVLEVRNVADVYPRRVALWVGDLLDRWFPKNRSR
jgi:hypothetical protein